MYNIDIAATLFGQEYRSRQVRAISLGVAAALAFGVALLGGVLAGRTTLVGIVSFAFLAMAGGVAVSRYGSFSTPRRRLWAYGLSSGAMLASAAALLAPKAISHHATFGGFAIAFGYLLGFSGHEFGHLFSHRELPLNATISELTLHALLAGSIMGVLYASLPSLTPLFGYGVVAHKLPAGFGGAIALDRDDLPAVVMALPAAAVGLAAIPVSVVTPDLGPVVRAVFYGISTGVFAHVALDMIPECHGGGEGHGHGGESVCSAEADAQRRHAVASTIAGAGVLFLAWLLVSGV
jgi:ZIP family zinc transporter